MVYIIKISHSLFIAEHIQEIRTTNFKLKAVKFDTKEQAKPVIEKLTALYKNINCLKPELVKL